MDTNTKTNTNTAANANTTTNAKIASLKKNLYRRIIVRTIVLAVWIIGFAGVLLSGGMDGMQNQTCIYMIAAILAMAVVYTVRDILRLRNTEYLKRAAIEQQDERNVLIAYKATRLAVTILLCAVPVAMCVFAYLGQQQIVNLLAMGVCLYLVIYLICWFVISKRS